MMLITGAALFSIGLAIVIMKKNAVVVLMGIELMLNAANLNFICFSAHFTDQQGEFFALFVIVIAAAEAAVGLAIIVRVYRHFKTVELDRINKLKG